MNELQTDVLILGDGLSGLAAAFTAAGAGRKVLLASRGGCASPAVIGFSCAAGIGDTPDAFAADMPKAGAGLNSKALVDVFTSGTRALPDWLTALGMELDCRDGTPELMRSLGHSTARLVHHGLSTGRECMEKLEEKLSELPVQRLREHCCLSLRTAGGITGAFLFDLKNSCVLSVRARAVVLATGGCHIAARSTYPEELTGDGFALAYQAGASLADLEFIQHEPLRCVDKRIGLSTTMLAEGGVLRNREGKRFILDSYENEAVPTKDELSRLIAMEIAGGHGTEKGGVFADLTGLDETAVAHHRRIYDRFAKNGMDLRTDRIEVKPAAHSIMGGVLIRPDCGTEVDGLYAAGEVTGGLHGASRLGGNAGSETLVMGMIAGSHAASYDGAAHADGDGAEFERWIRKLLKKPVYVPSLTVLRDRALEAMAQGMGPVRTKEGIEKTLSSLDTCAQALNDTGIASPDRLPKYMELGNLLLTARIACLGALHRQESRGAHARLDYPDQWDRPVHFVFQKDRGMSKTEE